MFAYRHILIIKVISRLIYTLPDSQLKISFDRFPGMRMIEKEAVRIGGGMNHRIGLFDMILLKDNHVDFAGGIENAISRCHDYLKAKGKDLKIEIEVRNLDELKEVMRVGGVDRIMLDNFSPELTKEAVKIVGGKYEIESSGGITFDTIRDYAESGVDPSVPLFRGRWDYRVCFIFVMT